MLCENKRLKCGDQLIRINSINIEPEINQSEIEFGSKCEMLPFSSVFPARNFCLKD